MLERIRESSQGIGAKIILGLVILSFAVAGVGSYINTQGDIPAAEVNGKAISQVEFDRAYQNERSRMEGQFGELFGQLASDENYMRNFRAGVLDRLVNQELSDQLADDLGLRISDAQVKKAIIEMPEFQVEGKFNNDRYLQLLARAGYQASAFREMLRSDMQRRQLLLALTDSEFSLPHELNQYAKLQDQTRDFTYAEVDLEQFKSDVVIEAAELEQEYQSTLDSYRTPEQVAITYLELTVDDLLPSIAVSDEDIQAQYESNMNAYLREERRRASHILISTGDDASASEAKAQALLAQVKAGEDFAALAKSNSEDTFSGENGGDLDFFGKGVMAPEFEEATFALTAIGDISDVVKTSFGYHIIKLTDIEAEAVQPLDDVKADIELSIKREKANILFIEKQQKVAELAFEISDSLIDAAAEVGVELINTPLFDEATAPAALNNPKILQAAFSEDVAQNGYNSELIEVDANRIVILRAQDYKPAVTQSLEEVKSQVEAVITTRKAKEAAEAWATELAATWANQDITESLTAKNSELKVVTAIGRNNTDVTGPIKRKAFEMAKPTDMSPSYSWVQFGNAVSVIKLTAVTTSEAEADDAVKQRLLSANSESQYRAVLEALKENSTIELPLPTQTDSGV
ncbi:SurA N-terminal domain-containing protein [Algibacillus agarilyticus]|uniref:SurA N-terminal domain-containing protein n=1 Tax=Algibacillus agarilyticus TaxID=2234133 RepID=UPI000DCFC0B2|nr:SurA N-terminal domain-containing protein [Algibacillus agarilyticus]